MSVFFAALAALSFGTADFLGGAASRTNQVFVVLVWSQFIGLLLALVVAPIVGAEAVALSDLIWGAVAGIVGAFGVAMLYHGLATTVVAIVSPTAALVGAAAPVLAGVILGERPGISGWIGVALAVPAIILLTTAQPHREEGAVGSGQSNETVQPRGDSQSDDDREISRLGSESRAKERRALLYGVVAGIGFGGFFILISRTGTGSGLWPLAAARTASIIAILIVALTQRVRLIPHRTGASLIGVAGLLDMAANVFFLLASRIGLLMISTVVTSLYPAPTVLLARAIHKERLGWARVIGLVVALAGVALMAIT